MSKLIIISTLVLCFCFSTNANPIVITSTNVPVKTSDPRFKIVQQKSESLIQSGLNAGDGYGEVWIRDLNTFIEPACRVGDKSKIRETLLTFFKFQGTDGNIVDGYIPRKDEKVNYDFIYSDLAPQYAAHKNTVETDQESSLIQAIAKYMHITGDTLFLKEKIAGRSVMQRMGDALKFLLNKRYNEKYGLLWGATTADWGDVQPEHEWGVKLDNTSHLCIDIYDNAMFTIAIKDYIALIDDKNEQAYWQNIRQNIMDNARKYLWDDHNQKFIPHIYLNGSPFPPDFDEDAIYYHGGTAVAVEAGMLDRNEILDAYHKMRQNVKATGAQTIGLTLYPVYPNGFFKNPDMGEYSYQNGGDWTWFGGRMVQQLIVNGFCNEAYEALSPMLDRVIKHGGFYEWWTPAGEPKGSGMFRGSAGVLWKAIKLLSESECLNSQLVHYNFGRAGNVTYALAPQEIKPVEGNGVLTVIGRPVFYADAPEEKTLKGEGAILFNGKEDGYKIPQSFGNAAGNLAMEVWVKSREVDPESSALKTVLANGRRKEGYLFAQQGGYWVLITGEGPKKIGNAVKEQWVHLALVVEDGKGSVWMNGKKTASFNPVKSFSANFSVAIDAEGENPFFGDIYEVRCSSFEKGGFNSDSDFLIDYKKKKRDDQNRLTERGNLIKNIESPAAGKIIVTELPETKQPNDWLITQVDEPARLFVKKSADGLVSMFQLNNGLVSRTFYVSENIACVGYKNLSNDAEYLRAVKPEARVRIDSVWYDVGGLKGQPELSYLLEGWYAQLEASDQAFTLTKVETGLPLERYPWNPKYNAVPTDWPAKGLRVEMTFLPTRSMPHLKDISVKVNYEIYQGLPVIAKWIEVENNGGKQVVLNEMECELLAVNQDQVERIHVESDFSFALVNADLQGSALMHYSGTPKAYHVGSSTTKWRVDKEYHTWATHNQAEDKFLDFPHRNLLVSTLPMGPSTVVDNVNPFKSYITFELLQDSDDRERKSLGHRRFYKKLAPQVTESLISGGITTHDEAKLKSFIDQMSELGLEQLDIMAWPGISHDNLDSAYVQHWRKIATYAKERGIVMGGYELQVASRGRGKEVDCIHPETGKPGSLFGQSVCIASEWKETYYGRMWEFFDRTGLMTYNMDGPYHGDPCASTEHPHHRGLEDSQWQQWKTQVGIIHELQRRNMYIPIPDWYFLNGQCVTGMGYREASANLSPQQQLLLGRQYIYDGTWHKIPPMGWMTLQLVGFYTNDPRVGLEPLSENLDRYEQQLIQYLASGCKLTIRGNRLYDTPETKEMLLKWINWFKEYRDILTSEIIHVSRPTGRDLDCMMHVNPFIDRKGMVIVFNPTDREIEKTIELPLYYTGLREQATLTTEDNIPVSYQLDSKSNLQLPVKIKAGGSIWFVIE